MLITGDSSLSDACPECGAPWGYPAAGPCKSCAPLESRVPRARDQMYMLFLQDLRRERDEAVAALAAVRSVPLVQWVRDTGWTHAPSSDFPGCSE